MKLKKIVERMQKYNLHQTDFVDMFSMGVAGFEHSEFPDVNDDLATAYMKAYDGIANEIQTMFYELVEEGLDDEKELVEALVSEINDGWTFPVVDGLKAEKYVGDECGLENLISDVMNEIETETTEESFED